MVNDFLHELYLIIGVLHMVWLLVGPSTIDKYLLSMVVDLEPQIRVSVAPDDRKRLVFRPFEQISARFGGTVSALQATHSSPLLPSECEFLDNLSLRRHLLPLPSSERPSFRHFRRRWAPERAGRW
jgi:hypothetical protein